MEAPEKSDASEQRAVTQSELGFDQTRAWAQPHKVKENLVITGHCGEEEPLYLRP
jgi:hypothetical protein